MPGNDGFYGSALQPAVSSGSGQSGHDQHDGLRVLTQMFAFGLFDKAPSGSPSATATNAADQAAATSAVARRAPSC